MTFNDACDRARAIRDEMTRTGRTDDAKAIVMLIVEASQPAPYVSNPDYPNDGRDGAQIIADAGMNDMGK